jgi:plasmid stabilization system protein ParE
VIYRVIIQPRANQDIQRIAYWLRGQSQSSGVALRWARAIRAKIATLKNNPCRCPIDPDSDAYGEETRMLLYGKRRGVYRVLFTIEDDKVHVVTVRHSAQQQLPKATDELGDEAADPNR